MSQRSNALADRLLRGADALADQAAALSEAEWRSCVPGDGRRIGVVVHHVASVYPLEIQLAKTVARGEAITGVTMDDVHAMNAAHAHDNDGVSKDTALEMLRHHSALAAAAIRALSNAHLDRAAPVSLYRDAVLTCQFVLEDHAVRHSYHHLARIRTALAPRISAALAG